LYFGIVFEILLVTIYVGKNTQVTFRIKIQDEKQGGSGFVLCSIVC
jgi:hypothetical protein